MVSSATSTRLDGRTAIVTGAARGIGLSIAQRLHREGAAVVIADLNQENAQQIAASFGERGTAVHVDVGDPESAEEMVRTVVDRYARIDILVNNAGVAGLARPVAEYPVDEWRRILTVNLDGVFYCSKAVLPHMLQRGEGRIVNIASISGKEGNPNMAAYSTSKAGVIGLTKAMGKELAQTGILVNCITPGVIATDLLEQLSQEAVEYMVNKIPMGRAGRPEEVAAMTAWLASPDCSFSTGAVFDLSGGRATY